MKVLVKDNFDGNLMVVEICIADARDQIDCEGKLFDVGSCVRFEDTKGDEILVVTDNMTLANGIVDDCFNQDKIDLTHYSESTIFYPTLEDDINQLEYFENVEIEKRI